MDTVTIKDAKEHLEELLEKAARGEDVRISDVKHGTVRLTPVRTPDITAPRVTDTMEPFVPLTQDRVPGRLKGKMRIPARLMERREHPCDAERSGRLLGHAPIQVEHARDGISHAPIGRQVRGADDAAGADDDDRLWRAGLGPALPQLVHRNGHDSSRRQRRAVILM